MNERQVTTDRPSRKKTIVVMNPQPLDDLDVKIQEAFARKSQITALMQQKQEEVEDLSRGHDDLHTQVEQQEKLIDQLYHDRDQGYQERNAKKDELYQAVGNIYQQGELCRMLEQQHLAKAKEAEDEYQKEVYTKGAEFYRELHWQYREKHRETVNERRNLAVPSNDEIIDARNRLRELKGQRASCVEKKRELIGEINELKKESKKLYDRIGGLKALQQPTAAASEELLLAAGIPTVFWPTAKAVTSNKGYVNIYYGELDDMLDWHGHVVIREGEIVYKREPKSIPQVVC